MFVLGLCPKLCLVHRTRRGVHCVIHEGRLRGFNHDEGRLMRRWTVVGGTAGGTALLEKLLVLEAGLVVEGTLRQVLRQRAREALLSVELVLRLHCGQKAETDVK
jgi:hypothetical protein